MGGRGGSGGLEKNLQSMVGGRAGKFFFDIA